MNILLICAVVLVCVLLFLGGIALDLGVPTAIIILAVLNWSHSCLDKQIRKQKHMSLNRR
ncbi:hypothetical protein VAEKB19_3820004 [Vibrio aestuarianus]|nr:hypothetical protein VAEKB19_3820004 [Vibrio aestuarianus]